MGVCSDRRLFLNVCLKCVRMIFSPQKVTDSSVLEKYAMATPHRPLKLSSKYSQIFRLCPNNVIMEDILSTDF